MNNAHRIKAAHDFHDSDLNTAKQLTLNVLCQYFSEAPGKGRENRISHEISLDYDIIAAQLQAINNLLWDYDADLTAAEDQNTDEGFVGARKAYLKEIYALQEVKAAAPMGQNEPYAAKTQRHDALTPATEENAGEEKAIATEKDPKNQPLQDSVEDVKFEVSQLGDSIRALTDGFMNSHEWAAKTEDEIQAAFCYMKTQKERYANALILIAVGLDRMANRLDNLHFDD